MKITPFLPPSPSVLSNSKSNMASRLMRRCTTRHDTICWAFVQYYFEGSKWAIVLVSIRQRIGIKNNIFSLSWIYFMYSMFDKFKYFSSHQDLSAGCVVRDSRTDVMARYVWPNCLSQYPFFSYRDQNHSNFPGPKNYRLIENFQLRVESNPGMFWFCFISLHDWSSNSRHFFNQSDSN